MLPFKSTVMICLAGPSQSGKTEQFKRIANYKDPDGTHPFRPVCLITCEASARGTAGELIASSGVKMISATNVDEFIAACDEAADGLDGEPFGLIIFDGWTTLQEGLNADDRVIAAKASAKLAGASDDDPEVLSKGRTLDPRDPQNDNFRLAKGPADWTRVCLRYWNGLAARCEGSLMLSTCIVRDDMRNMGKGRELQLVQVGSKLALAPSPSEFLGIYNNLVLYLDVILPEIETPDEADETDAEPEYFILSRRFKVGGMELKFIKWQEGIIDIPKYYANPDLGAALGKSPLRSKKPDKPAAAKKPSDKSK